MNVDFRRDGAIHDASFLVAIRVLCSITNLRWENGILRFGWEWIETPTFWLSLKRAKSRGRSGADWRSDGGAGGAAAAEATERKGTRAVSGRTVKQEGHDVASSAVFGEGK